jgi:hypothetical protein
MMVSETPGRTSGPGLLLDESVYNEMFPSGAVLSPVMVTFCPSLNIGSEGGATGALAAVGGGGVVAGDTGVTATVGAVGGKGAEASLPGGAMACGGAGIGAGGATGAGAAGLGFMATGGGVLSPK